MSDEKPTKKDIFKPFHEWTRTGYYWLAGILALGYLGLWNVLGRTIVNNLGVTLGLLFLMLMIACIIALCYSWQYARKPKHKFLILGR